jgi:DNA-binding NtrC family response regulator/tetratricopeptide (TPR) repeat protein
LESKDLEHLCWAQLRLYKILFDSPDISAAEAFRDHLRRNVDRLGSSHVSVAYHVFSAEAAAKGGRVLESRKHGELAESILSRSPNVWLRGLLDIQYSCWNYLAGDYPAAIKFAIRAVRESIQSADSDARIVALADLASSYLAMGQFRRANRCIDVALRGSSPIDQAYSLLIETLAETRLAERDEEGCRSLLTEARANASTFSQTRSEWHRTWNARTELRLLMRDGRMDEVIDRASEILSGSKTRLRSFTCNQISLIRTRALVANGSPHEAAQTLSALLLDSTDRSFLTIGQVNSILGSLLSRTIGAELALPIHARALRILAAADSCEHLDAVEIFLRDAGLQPTPPPTFLGESDLGRIRRPTKIQCHLDKVSSVGQAGVVSQSEILSFCASMPALLSRPRVAAEELLRLLIRVGWATTGDVVASALDGKHGDRHTGFEVDNSVRGKDNTDGSKALRIAFGAEAGRGITLLVCPANTPEGIVSCACFGHLVQSLRTELEPVDESLSEGSRASQAESRTHSGGVFHSRSMIEVVDTATRIATLDVTVLLTGESGTGKEVVARIIHDASLRAAGPFIPFNCASLPRELIDSQLFGYRKGAFTGATESFGGIVKAATHGTLFLDEIGDLPLDVQPKLLRFLDGMEILPLGESKPQRVDVRIVAATNANLEQLVSSGRFREDLYYRLSVFRFRLPPLRERRDEIPHLVTRFVADSCREFGKDDVRISDEALAHIMLGQWPGNLRQLRHEIRRVVALAESGTVVGSRALSPDILTDGELQQPSTVTPGAKAITLHVDRPLQELQDELERAAIGAALTATGGRTEDAALRLGISRKGLYLKRRRLGL